VAAYIGQTAVKTREVLERALGGTLFIDEPYSLVMPPDMGFGTEALETILEFMEENRGRLVIVAAGFEKETRKGCFCLSPTAAPPPR